MTDKETMQQALEAMETNQYTVAELAPHKVVMKFNDAITALREALAQPAQESVAFYHPQYFFYRSKRTHISAPTVVDVESLPLYAAPPAAQRPWVGLKIEEVQDSYNSDYQAQTRAVEKLLKERNT